MNNAVHAAEPAPTDQGSKAAAPGYDVRVVDITAGPLSAPPGRPRLCPLCERSHGSCEQLRRCVDLRDAYDRGARATAERVAELEARFDALRAEYTDLLAERDAMQCMLTQAGRAHKRLASRLRSIACDLDDGWVEP